MKLPLSTMIEEAKRRVAALLDLRSHKPGADRMNGPGWHEEHVVG